MAKKDYSKYSDEELEKIAGGNQQPSNDEEPGFLKSLGHGYLNYAGGALRGMGQAVGDLGASALNAPISGMEYLSGHKIPHIPHPNLINEHPSSFGESLGQNLGQLTGGLALPGGAGMKAAQLAGKGYQALRAGEQLPLIGRLLAGGAGGATEGALGNEENRTLGAELGGLAGAAGHAIPSAINFAKSMSSKNIAKHVTDEVKRLNEHFNERFTSPLVAGEEAGANKFLRPLAGDIDLLKQAGETGLKKGEKKLTYALQKYNENPSLQNAHNAQRDLGKIERLHKGATPGTLEGDAYKEALMLKNRLLEKIKDAMTNAENKTKYHEFYHATNPENVNDILGKGLKSSKYEESFPTLTNHPEVAKAYSARKNFDEPGELMKIKIPEEKLNKYIHNEHTNWATKANMPRGYENAKLYGTKSEIPAKYISHVKDEDLINPVKENMGKKSDLWNKYQQAREDYSRDVVPYIESDAIRNLLGKNKSRTQTLRPQKFADKLLKEEEFITRSGENHPGLLRREKLNALKRNKLAHGVAIGAGGLAAGYLPYEISKLLGLR